MENRELFFISSFIFTLLLLMFFFEVSITGQVVQTAYCDETGCFDFCKFNTDCSPNLCCRNGDVGICKSECNEFFEFKPDLEIEYPNINLEEPTQVRPNTGLFLVLLLLTLLIGGLYTFFKGKVVHIKIR